MIEDLMDHDFTTYASMQDLRKNFPDKNNIYFVLKRKDGQGSPSSSELCDLLAWMGQAARISGVTHIFSSFGPRIVNHTQSTIRFDPILRPQCGRYGNDAIEAPQVSAELNQIKESPFGGFLTSSKADDVVVSLYLQDEKQDLRFGAFNPKFVEAVRDSLKTTYLAAHPNLEAVWTGIGTYQYYLKLAYDQSAILNLLAIAVILILFRLIYGTWKSGLIFQGTLMITLMLVYGIMGLFSYPIDSLSNSLPTLVMVATLEDFIYLSYLKQRKGQSTRSATRKILVPAFFTSLTTSIGFGSLLTSDLSIIRRFGLECALAALVEYFVIILVLPSFLRKYPNLDSWTMNGISGLERFSGFISRVRGKARFSAGLSLIYFGLLFIPGNLNVNDSPEEIFPQDHAVVRAADFLKNTRGWKSEVSLVFEDDRHEARNRQIIQKIRSDEPLVAYVEDPYRSRDFLETSKLDDENALARVVWNTSVFARRLVSENGDLRAVLYLKSTDIVHMNELRVRMAALCSADCHLAGTLNSYGEFGSRVLGTLFSSLASSLLLVGLLLVFLCVSFREKRIIRLLLSSMWGVTALLFVFWAFQIKVFFVTSIIASIVVGLAGDNAIQFLFFGRRRGLQSGVDTLAVPATLLTFCMTAVSGVLFFSDFGALRVLALFMILGYWLTLIGDVWILKGFLAPKAINSIDCKD